MDFHQFSKMLMIVINIPAYWMAKLVPKDYRLWLFGAWFGRQYSDNSKYLYEYVLRAAPEIRAVWVSSSATVRDAARAAGGLAVSPYSIRGYWMAARAACGVVSNSNRDLNMFIPPKHMFNLWHGLALKKIWNDNRHERHLGFWRHVVRIVAPFFEWRMDLGIASLSATHADQLAKAFGVSPSTVRIDGYPRNDFLLEKAHGDRSEVIYRVSYLPTFRDRSGYQPLDDLMSIDILELNERLSGLNVEMVIGLHPVSLVPIEWCDHSNIRLRDERDGDTSELLANSDCLITDYSSVYFDFLLTRRPIIFAPFDLDEYVNIDRELYFDYDEVTPGPKCFSWTEIVDWLARFVGDSGLDEFWEQREKLRVKLHSWDDTRSSERTLAYLRGSLARGFSDG